MAATISMIPSTYLAIVQTKDAVRRDMLHKQLMDAVKELQRQMANFDVPSTPKDTNLALGETLSDLSSPYERDQETPSKVKTIYHELGMSSGPVQQFIGQYIDHMEIRSFLQRVEAPTSAYVLKVRADLKDYVKKHYTLTPDWSSIQMDVGAKRALDTVVRPGPDGGAELWSERLMTKRHPADLILTYMSRRMVLLISLEEDGSSPARLLPAGPTHVWNRLAGQPKRTRRDRSARKRWLVDTMRLSGDQETQAQQMKGRKAAQSLCRTFRSWSPESLLPKLAENASRQEREERLAITEPRVSELIGLMQRFAVLGMRIYAQDEEYEWSWKAPKYASEKTKPMVAFPALRQHSPQSKEDEATGFQGKPDPFVGNDGVVIVDSSEIDLAELLK